MIKIINNLMKYWPLILLVLFFSFFYFQFINLVNADLGRHIINGKEILLNLNSLTEFLNNPILNKNYYSYSQPDATFTNHHWLFGVMVYLIKNSFGFSGVTIFNLTLCVGALIFALLLALKKLGQQTTIKNKILFIIIAGLIALPLITSRTEIRPESLSLFMFSEYLYIFTSIKKMKFLLPITILLLVSQIIWTNTHLFFIFGPFISGLFLLNSIWKNTFIKKSNKLINSETIFLFFITIGLFIVTTINPHGLNGSLSPFHIFDNYGYRVAENQSTWFMISIGNQVVKFGYFIGAYILGLITFLILSFNSTKNKVSNFMPFILLIVFGTMTQLINRISSFFGIILIPILAQNLFLIYKQYRFQIEKIFHKTWFLMILSPITIALIIFLTASRLLFPSINNIGMGLAPEINSSINFFKENKLSGPIFNNYDLGGYLIYHLFPDHKIFVDNRPEAYSESFFKNEYIAAQESEDSWKIISDKYNFETIYFFRLDQTNWAQGFLHRRVLDPNWVPVYVDNYILILVKNDQNNKEVIDKYELPKEIFTLRK